MRQRRSPTDPFHRRGVQVRCSVARARTARRCGATRSSTRPSGKHVPVCLRTGENRQLVIPSQHHRSGRRSAQQGRNDTLRRLLSCLGCRDGVSVEEVSELLEGLSVDDVNYAENEGAATVLHAAAAQGSEEVRALPPACFTPLSSLDDVNCPMYTWQLVELLLDAGADPCALDERGRVPYYLCANKVG